MAIRTIYQCNNFTDKKDDAMREQTWTNDTVQLLFVGFSVFVYQILSYAILHLIIYLSLGISTTQGFLFLLAHQEHKKGHCA